MIGEATFSHDFCAQDMSVQELTDGRIPSMNIQKLIKLTTVSGRICIIIIHHFLHVTDFVVILENNLQY